MTGRDDRERRFDDELARAARSLVTEELPRGVMGEPVSASLGLGGAVDGSVAARRPLPGFAAAAAAVVLLLATVVVVAPQLPGGSGPSTTPTLAASPTPSPGSTVATSPTFRGVSDIRADFERLSYTCRDGQPLESVVPGPSAVVRESVVCLPASNAVFMGAVIVGESASGTVEEVHAKADFIGDDTPAAREEVAVALAKAAALVVREGTGTAVGEWVHATAPGLEADESDKTQVQGYAIRVGRTSDGGYQLVITIAATT